jgi:hypothetical protein
MLRLNSNPTNNTSGHRWTKTAISHVYRERRVARAHQSTIADACRKKIWKEELDISAITFKVQ